MQYVEAEARLDSLVLFNPAHMAIIPSDNLPMPEQPGGGVVDDKNN